MHLTLDEAAEPVSSSLAFYADDQSWPMVVDDGSDLDSPIPFQLAELPDGAP